MPRKKVTTTSFALLFALLLLAPILTSPVLTLDEGANSLKVSVSAYPKHIQEGNNVTIILEILQAESNKTYIFGINVTNPTGISSAKNVSLTTNAEGFGNLTIEYWGDFKDANTDYLGIYLVEVKNATTNEIQATTSFAVSLTDKLKYARNETVKIQGSGYSANENLTINIQLNEEQIVKQNVTASIAGTINYTWQIPGNATSGLYKVSITNATSPGTVKKPPDIQEFFVEVWSCRIQARNLAGEPVENLTIRAYNQTIVPSQFLNLSQLTNETGWAPFLLATGNYTFKAFWKQVEVGIFPLTNIKNDTILEKDWVQLSNLRIRVIDGATNEYLPFIQLRLEYNYTTEANETITEISYFETNFTGTVLIRNLFVNLSYAVEAKRYGFSLPPIESKTLPLQWNTLTVKFPVYTASIHVVDSKNNPIEGVKVEAYEWNSGLGQPQQSKITNSNGNVTFFLTFGKYKVRVYKDDILLKEDTIDLVLNQSSFIIHLVTFNVDLNVAVIDYFGQPIPNALVKVEKTTTAESVENTTGPDGRATFNGILGGDSRISIYIGGKLCGSRSLYLTNSKQVTFNLNRYVVIAGYALETSQFVVTIAMVLLIVVFLVGLTYKRLLKIFGKSK